MKGYLLGILVGSLVALAYAPSVLAASQPLIGRSGPAVAKALQELNALGEQCSYETIDAWRSHTVIKLKEIESWLQTPEGAVFVGKQGPSHLDHIKRTIENMDRPIRVIGLNSSTAGYLTSGYEYVANWRKNDKLFKDRVNYKWQMQEWIGRYAFACYNRELKRRGFVDSVAAKCEITPNDKPMTVSVFPNRNWPHNSVISRCGYDAASRQAGYSGSFPSPPSYGMTPFNGVSTISAPPSAGTASVGTYVASVADDKADNAEIRLNRDQVMQALKTIPYAEEGKGPVIYVIAYSSCPHARRFENDWRGKLGDVKVRYVLYGIDDRTASEAAELALTRNAADFHRFMAGTKTAPSVRSTNQRIDAFNSVVNPLKNTLQPALKANGYKERITSPHFFYSDGRRLLTQGGYSRESFADILKTAQAGYVKATQREPVEPNSVQ